jgi:hypothetical protein
MAETYKRLSPQVKALKNTDLSPFINMSNLMVPRMLGVFLPKLNQKERKAFDKVMPVGGGKKIYVHLVGSATPPIVVEMAQPMKMTTLPEAEVKLQQLKGIKINVEDIQLLTEKKTGKFIWRIKSQIGTMLGLSGMFAPFIALGPKGIMDLKNKAMTHFKPLMDMIPH